MPASRNRGGGNRGRRGSRAVRAALPGPVGGFYRHMAHALAHADSAACAFEIVAHGALQMGFEYCAYGLRIPTSFTRPETLMISNYDVRWQQRYREANYLACDPTVAHGARSTVPLVWSSELAKCAPKMWSEARSFGLRVGWAQSSFDAHSIGMLSVSRSHEPLTRNETAMRGPQLRWLANIAHEFLGTALYNVHVPPQPALTAREVEVLRWSADGKSSADVAVVLEISVNTVNFHVRNIIAKLQVANKMAAVSRASATGLLK